MKIGRSGKRAVVLLVCAAAVLGLAAVVTVGMTAGRKQQSGQIFLYGEEHAVDSILEREFELWSEYYHDRGMRDLFVELPYYTAEYLNLWMRSENDDILNLLYGDWAGTAMHSQDVIDFYGRIKKECPETVFHGTDVGHQYETTGKRFLEYLEADGRQQSEPYRLALENIEQGKRYYGHSDNAYREKKMVENFVREIDSLSGSDVMGIYGSAHTATDNAINLFPTMASRLRRRYGDALHIEDLSPLARNREPYRTDVLEIGGKEYNALYFGKTDLSAVLPEYQCREFWRLEEAYGDFKDSPVTGNVLPYNNYPMAVETGQIFVIEYTKADGTVFREYHRSDGNQWRGAPVTEEFALEEE